MAPGKLTMRTMAAEDFHLSSQSEKGAAARAEEDPGEQRRSHGGRTFPAEKGAEERTFPPPRRSTTPGPIAEASWVHIGLVLEDILYRFSESGGGSAEQAQLNLLLDGDTFFLSTAQDAHRKPGPSMPQTQRYQSRMHQRLELHPGPFLQLVSIEPPTGGNPARARAHLLRRRP